MTDATATAPRPARRRPSFATVALTSLAAFLALLAFLAFQVRTGHDPALSAQAKVAVARQPQRIVLRKVEDDYVITKVIPASGSAQPALTTGSSGGGVSVSSPTVVSSSAPAAVIPAPVTRTS